MRKNGVRGIAAQDGFTLVELMVTVAIVAILATIAAETYSSQVRQSRRTDARSAIMDMAGREEKLFSTTNAYSNVPANLGYVGAFPLTIGSGYYQINVVVPDPAQGVATATTYLITATPIGSQATDTQCASLSVNQLGVQTFTGTGTQQTCWGN